MYRGFILAVAATGLIPGLGPFAAFAANRGQKINFKKKMAVVFDVLSHCWYTENMSNQFQVYFQAGYRICLGILVHNKHISKDESK